MTARARSRGCRSNVKSAHFTVDEPALIVRTAGGVVMEFALSTDLLTERNGVLKRGSCCESEPIQLSPWSRLKVWAGQPRDLDCDHREVELRALSDPNGHARDLRLSSHERTMIGRRCEVCMSSARCGE